MYVYGMGYWNLVYFDHNHSDMFLLNYLKYIPVKTQLYFINYTCSDMFRLNESSWG